MTKLLLFILLFSFVSAFSHFSDCTYLWANVFPQTKDRLRTCVRVWGGGGGVDHRILFCFIITIQMVYSCALYQVTQISPTLIRIVISGTYIHCPWAPIHEWGKLQNQQFHWKHIFFGVLLLSLYPTSFLASLWNCLYLHKIPTEWIHALRLIIWSVFCSCPVKSHEPLSSEVLCWFTTWPQESIKGVFS